MISWDQAVVVLLALPGTVVSVLAIWDWVEKRKQKKQREKELRRKKRESRN